MKQGPIGDDAILNSISANLIFCPTRNRRPWTIEVEKSVAVLLEHKPEVDQTCKR